MKTETVNRTVICRTESSQRKRDRLQEHIDEWQKFASHVADLAPSFGQGDFSAMNTQLNNVRKREFDDSKNMAHCMNEAYRKVTEAYESWWSNGSPGEDPDGNFGDGNYFRTPAKYLELHENDRGFGLEVTVEPRSDNLWLHLDTAEYHEEYFDRVVDGDAELGASELRIDGNEVYAHVVVQDEVEVLDPSGAKTFIGVDLGENVCYALGTVGMKESAEIRKGGEFRHHRDRLSRRIEEAQEGGELSHVTEELSGERLKYTDQMTHTFSREIVDFAFERAKPCIVLEDLTGYRKQKQDVAIHDWPYNQMQEKITYKATAKGIPVVTVNPAYTSRTCRKCGESENATRDGSEFWCDECGYEVHADVNAAFNIAERGRQKV